MQQSIAMDEVSPATELASKLQRLFGKRWRERGAEVLGVDPVTIWRWATGRVPVPQSALMAVRGLKLTARRTKV